MAKQNAYSMFVSEEARRRNVNKNILFSVLGKEWEKLTDEQRQPYKDKAAAINKGIPYTPSGPTERPLSITSTPHASTSSPKLKAETHETSSTAKRPIEVDVPMKSEKKFRPGIPFSNKYNGALPEPNRYKDLHLFKLRNQCEAIVESRKTRLVEARLYSFSCNVMCRQKRDEVETFYPIEIGICTYSLKDGNCGCEPYHVLIDAGPAPANYISLAYDHAEATHKIPFPPRQAAYPEAARRDYKQIYKEMLEYTKAGERTILVSDARDLAQATGSLEWLYARATADNTSLPKVSTWTILPVTEFIAAMYNYVYQKILMNPTPKFAIHYYLKVLLDTSLMDFNEACMCDFHRLPENQTKWCARSCAMRSFPYMEEKILEEIYQMYTQANDAKKRAEEAKRSPVKERKQQQPIALTVDQMNRIGKDQPLLPGIEPQFDPGTAQTSLALEAPLGVPVLHDDPKLQELFEQTANQSDAAIVVDETGSYVIETIERPRKKPKEPLVIASGGRHMDNPPDIY